MPGEGEPRNRDRRTPRPVLPSEQEGGPAMGYDCTFHLMDERAMREEFVPRLLGRSQAETALDRVREDATELWELGRLALEGGVNKEGEQLDDESVASLVCQLALVFSACSLPHHYERGWAFSLWPE